MYLIGKTKHEVYENKNKAAKEEEKRELDVDRSPAKMMHENWLNYTRGKGVRSAIQTMYFSI